MDTNEKQEHWRGLIEGQSQSGLSVVAWCAANGLKEWQYYAWKKRLNKVAIPKQDQLGGFIPLELPSCASLSIRFGQDVHVEVGADCGPALLRAALEAVLGRSRCWR